MLERLQAIEARYDELSRLLSDPAVLSRQGEWQQYAKEQAGLAEMVGVFRSYQTVEAEIRSAEAMLREDADAEMQEFLTGELTEMKEKLAQTEEALKILLLPKDPNDEKNVLMEIRAGAGGEEAALFAGELFRMYTRYAERQGWKMELMNTNPTDIGGFKEVILMLEGKDAYRKLKFESGVHRVQRIPSTESGGRIHTSTVTVAVLPEAEEVDVAIDPNDLRIDTFCASGPGGQSVNTTYSAVRITHIPSGLVVSCQDEKSQQKNRIKALRVLRARLMDIAEAERQSEESQARKSQVGTGDRSERIRTYNFPQGRVTDHRIGLTLHRLYTVLEGDLEEMVEALISADQAEKLKKVE